MSSLLSDSRVTVHVGDGFAFLSSHEQTYDAIITDSSDPVGPAQSLFQKPYFKLLHDALTPGGHISTQGECLWLHLPLIKELFGTTAEAGFAQTEYAFTTIPTYPSGQIGFMLCVKGDKERSLREPKRSVPGCKYWNEDVHRAAFVLPEFARKRLQEGEDIAPKLGRQAKDGEKRKKILLLGSGYVARPCAEYVVRDPMNDLTIGELIATFQRQTLTFSRPPQLAVPWHLPKPSPSPCETLHRSPSTSTMRRAWKLLSPLMTLSSPSSPTRITLPSSRPLSKARPTSSLLHMLAQPCVN